LGIDLLPHQWAVLQLDDLRAIFQLAHDLIAGGVGDLRVDLGVSDIAVPQVVLHIGDVLAGVQDVHRDRVAIMPISALST